MALIRGVFNMTNKIYTSVTSILQSVLSFGTRLSDIYKVFISIYIIIIISGF